MKKFHFSLIIISLIVCSCSPLGTVNQPTVSVENDKTRLQTVSPSKTSLANHESTIIPTIETKIIPSITPKVTQTSPFQQLEIIGDAPTCSPVATNGSIDTPGTILYQYYGDKGLYAADGKNFTLVKNLVSSEQKVFVFGVSPDGSTIAYSLRPNNKNQDLEKVEPVVKLLEENGKTIEHKINMDWPKNKDQENYELVNFVHGFWLNNNLIFAYINSKITEDISSPNITPQIGNFLPILFDPFTGKVHTSLLERFMPTNGRTTYNISPDLKRLLVFDYSSGLINLIAVADNGAITDLWKADIPMMDAFVPISWSSNSEWAVFLVFNSETNSNIYQTILLSREGKAFILKTPLFNGLVFTDLAWSPDSRYFAFVAPKNETLYNFYVFDTLHSKLILNCPFTTIRPNASIVWSPDSTSIATSTYEKPIRIVNINTRLYKDLDLFGDVVGWSDKFVVTP